MQPTVATHATPPDVTAISLCHIQQSRQADVYVYDGRIEYDEYAQFMKVAGKPASEQALLILRTQGGNPDVAYKIAQRLLRRHKRFTLFVPANCKSAGTLIALAANELIMSDAGELGPLDIQFQKPKEILDQNSGLDLVQSLNYLEVKLALVFQQQLGQLRINTGLSTELCAELAMKLAVGLYGKIGERIDPIQLGEINRKIGIAQDYGNRLARKGGNLKGAALTQLIMGYSSHSFVIDREEASTLFNRVAAPTDAEQVFADGIGFSGKNPISMGFFPFMPISSLQPSTSGVAHGDSASTNTASPISADGGKGVLVAEPERNDPTAPARLRRTAPKAV